MKEKVFIKRKRVLSVMQMVFCPLIKEECKEAKCGWWTSDGCIVMWIKEINELGELEINTNDLENRMGSLEDQIRTLNRGIDWLADHRGSFTDPIVNAIKGNFGGINKSLTEINRKLTYIQAGIDRISRKVK